MWANEHIRIRSGVVGFPDNPTLIGRECRHPTPHTHLTAAIAHQHLILHDQWRHRDGFALIDIAQGGFPDLLARLRVHGNRVSIQRVIEDSAIGIRCPTVDLITAGDPLGCRSRLGVILPLQWRTGLGEIKRI